MGTTPGCWALPRATDRHLGEVRKGAAGLGLGARHAELEGLHARASAQVTGAAAALRGRGRAKVYRRASAPAQGRRAGASGALQCGTRAVARARALA